MRIAVQKGSGSFWKLWEREILLRGKKCSLLDVRSPKGFNEASQCDGIMWHIDMNPSMQAAASYILKSLESSTDINVFPNISTRWHFDNKVAQYYLLKNSGVNIPKTYVFWNEQKAIDWVNNDSVFPLIAKLKRGASSSCVYKLSNKHDAQRFVKKMFSVKGIRGNSEGIGVSYRRGRNFLKKVVLHLPTFVQRSFLTAHPNLKDTWPNEKGYVYFQEFLQKNAFDTRITVIGNRAFGFTRQNRIGDFRASGSGNINYSNTSINMEMVRESHEFSKKYNFQSMAYDYLIDESGNPSLVEMSFGYQSKAIESCSGYWDRKLNWVKGNILPEAAQVEDFLEEVSKHSL